MTDRREHQCVACDSAAEFTLRLVFMTVNLGVGRKRFECPTTMKACKAHLDKARDVIMHHSNRAEVERLLKEDGLTMPDWDTAEIEAYPIERKREPLVIENSTRPILACDIGGCILPARYQIGLQLYRIGSKGRGRADAKTLINLCICDKHSREITAQDVLTPEHKSILLGSLTQRGFPMPDFKLTKIELIPIFDGKKADPAKFERA